MLNWWKNIHNFFSSKIDKNFAKNQKSLEASFSKILELKFKFFVASGKNLSLGVEGED